MSAFIVISVKESLNWIVDGIKNCRPHNPDVVTCISTGKMKKSTDDTYLYEYTTFSKHHINLNNNGKLSGNTDRALPKIVESGTPRDLFSNQIAQFLNVSENEGEQINIFLLDNPMTDTDFEHSSWIVDEIRAVYESRKSTNFQLVRVLFSYQIDKPTDVNTQVSGMILKQLTNIEHNEQDDFLSKILYIDNQNRQGAALCLNKEDHDIMIPRMLCDFMMLLSNKEDSYNVAAAVTGETRVFAVGYSECMYYHDDVFRYYDIAGRRDLIKHLLEAENGENSLDFKKNPIGLKCRIKRLEPKYFEVPFEQDISFFEASIDKTIDDILVMLKDDIIGIRQDAIHTASLNDAAETKKQQIAHIKSQLNFPSNDISDEDLDVNHIAIAADLGIDISQFIVTTAVELAKKEYPLYIDRKLIYEQYLIEDEEREDFEGLSLTDKIKAYNRLINFVQKTEFKKYVNTSCTEKKDISTSVNYIDNPQRICFLKRLFRLIRRAPETCESTPIREKQEVTRNWRSIRDAIASIPILYAEREQYFTLKAQANKMQEEVDAANEELRQFKLTSHCSTVDNLIDLEKLKEFHTKGLSTRISKIVDCWNARCDQDRHIDTLFEDMKEYVKWEKFNFYYINWEEPFAFIKNLDNGTLAQVCNRLIRRSQPFVNAYTLDTNAENLTSFIFYTDNPIWNDAISQKRIGLKKDNQLSCTLSRHICSKICMFQFLQMSKQLINGLVDCYSNQDY